MWGGEWSIRDSKGRERILASITHAKPSGPMVPVPSDSDDVELERDAEEAAFKLIEERLDKLAEDKPPPVLGLLADVPAGQPPAEAQMWACDQLPDADVAHIREKLVRVPWRRRPPEGQVREPNGLKSRGVFIF